MDRKDLTAKTRHRKEQRYLAVRWFALPVTLMEVNGTAQI